MNEYRDYLDRIGIIPARAGIGMYALGLVLSLALTIGAYALAQAAPGMSGNTMALLAALALLQFAVQTACFLHAGPHLSHARAAMFSAAIVVVVILVGGSIWIMTNLNGRMMPGMTQMEQYMQDQDGF
jgi:cytochrome o ubiquinol oxidase operon protein cyoD